MCSVIDFRNEEPLQLPANLNLTVAFNCGGRALHLYSTKGRMEIPDGTTLSFVGCYVRTYESEADAVDVPGGPEAAYTLFGGQPGSALTATNSVILYPSAVCRQLAGNCHTPSMLLLRSISSVVAD
jgi:hypothetical protein